MVFCLPCCSLFSTISSLRAFLKWHLNNLLSLTQKKRRNIISKHFNSVREKRNLKSLKPRSKTSEYKSSQLTRSIPGKTDKGHYLGINKVWALTLCQHNLILIIPDSITIWLCLLLPFLIINHEYHNYRVKQLKVALKDDSWDWRAVLSRASRWHSFFPVISMNGFHSSLHNNQRTKIGPLVLHFYLMTLSHLRRRLDAYLTHQSKFTNSNFCSQLKKIIIYHQSAWVLAAVLTAPCIARLLPRGSVCFISDLCSSHISLCRNFQSD